MDDEGEVRDMNLSSRPKREERRRQRERDRLEREMDRDHRADGGQASSLEWSSIGWDGGEKPCVPRPYTLPFPPLVLVVPALVVPARTWAPLHLPVTWGSNTHDSECCLSSLLTSRVHFAQGAISSIVHRWSPACHRAGLQGAATRCSHRHHWAQAPAQLRCERGGAQRGGGDGARGDGGGRGGGARGRGGVQP